jgi:hypothetical protein
MYGIANRSIEDFITQKFGVNVWMEINEKSGLESDAFMTSHLIYENDVIYEIAQLTADLVQLPLADILIAFGQYWILSVSEDKYASILMAGGRSIKEVLIHLPTFNDRLMLLYPKLIPPEFRITDIQEKSLQLHCISTKIGFRHFVVGMVNGLSILYQTPANIHHSQSKQEKTHFHDIFDINW